MQTITTKAMTAASASPILAIDLGKYKSVVCIFRSPDDVRFTSVPTTLAELRRQIDQRGQIYRCGITRREPRSAIYTEPGSSFCFMASMKAAKAGSMARV